jgi:hypothetical protein
MPIAKPVPGKIHTANLETPSDLKSNATTEVSGALNIVLADLFALYVKTKNFHWHVSGPHFRDYHLLLEDQATQILGATDAAAERASARSAAPQSAPSIISAACSACSTTTPRSSHLRTCWPSCTTTTSSWSPTCARRTPSAANAATSPPRACWRTGSTKPNSAPGSCSKRGVRHSSGETWPTTRMERSEICPYCAALHPGSARPLSEGWRNAVSLARLNWAMLGRG